MNVLVKIWLNIGILGQNKIGLVCGFCVCHFIGIGLVSVCNFPENDISSPDSTRTTAARQRPRHQLSGRNPASCAKNGPTAPERTARCPLPRRE